MAEQQKSKKKLVNKFFEVKAPLTSSKISLYGSSAESFQGKVVRIDLTRVLRGKNAELLLKLNVHGEDIEGEPISLNVFGSYIRRMMRGGIDYVEDSFDAECKDAFLTIKPFIITRKKVPRSLRNALRVEAQNYLKSICVPRTSLELFGDLMSNKIQKDLSLKLKKLYPLAFCEIRAFQIKRKK
ncbi:MAG: hypothetical protein AABX66_00630 [Nanoarchaeota archaeon]